MCGEVSWKNENDIYFFVGLRGEKDQWNRQAVF